MNEGVKYLFAGKRKFLTILAVLGLLSAPSYFAGSTHSPSAQQKTVQTTTLEEQVKGARVTPTPTEIPTPIVSLEPTHVYAAPTTAFIPPTQAPVQQSAPVYSDGDKDCTDFATHAEAQAFFEAAGAGDPHRLDRDGDGIACETLP